MNEVYFNKKVHNLNSSLIRLLSSYIRIFLPYQILKKIKIILLMPQIFIFIFFEKERRKQNDLLLPLLILNLIQQLLKSTSFLTNLF